MNSWIEALLPIIEEYGEGEPLDGDAVDDLCVILRAKINFHQGNITEEEYETASNNKDIYKEEQDRIYSLEEDNTGKAVVLDDEILDCEIIDSK